MIRSIFILFGILIATPAISEETPDYTKHIKPLLQKRCYACHGNLKQRGGLRLDVRSTILQGGDNGPAIVPGNVDESVMLEAIQGKNGFQRMPLEGEPLKQEEIDLLIQWIKSGAPGPDEPIPSNPREHWSFQRPVRPSLPDIAAPDWRDNPVDRFLAEAWSKQKLSPRPLAKRNVQLRRLFIDLIGLPPTRQQLQEFLADNSADAYEKVVDRLLASPQYGERWGRHWMDVWRYSDWDGYGAEIRESQAHIWRWRDWIVESLNADKPYDQMIREMLAADEMAPDQPESLRATGFLVRNYFKFNRNVWLDNTIEHTFKAFQGITLNCARCHDHMYDPISQKEYYQARAIFEPYDVRTDRIAGQPDVAKDGIVRVFDANAATPTYLLVRGDDKNPLKDQPLTPGIPTALGGNQISSNPVQLPAVAYYPGLRKYAHDEARIAAESNLKRAEDSTKEIQTTLANTQQKLAEVQAGAKTDAVTAIIDESFKEPRDTLWKQLNGQWSYEGGRLIQKQVGAGSCKLLAQSSIPTDFIASFRFKITGGQMWKSVGMTYDVLDESEGIGIYLSAFAGGPKVQVFVTSKGQQTYPAEAAKPLQIALNEEHELTVYVKNDRMNVAVDGKPQFAYKVAKERLAKGQFRLWTFDASAEFLNLKLLPLSSNTVLLETVTPESKFPESKPLTAEALQASIADITQMLTVALKKALAAQANLASVNARIIADEANYASPRSDQAGPLSQAAVKAEREVALAQADVDQLVATQAVEKLKRQIPDLTKANDQQKKSLTDAETKVTQATKAFETAKTSLNSPLTENYTRFGPVYATTSTGRRLALAQWLSDRSNPLTARVAVNHIWARHFGTPMVSTMFDFGVNGKPSVLPNLLDYLAVELMDSGWKMKQVHRMIVTSRAYRLASDTSTSSDSNLSIDPENQYFWRANVHRMEAEIVRDSTLSACEQLDLTAGGPDLDPASGQTVPRRSLYFRSAKEKKVQFLAMFDSANPVECYRRSESIVPQQALAMANSSLTLAQARLFARKLSQEVGEGVQLEIQTRFVQAAVLQLLNREATDAEVKECLSFMDSQTQRFASGKGLTASGGAAETHVKPSATPHLRARENLIHVLLNHNDFITIR